MYLSDVFLVEMMSRGGEVIVICGIFIIQTECCKTYKE